MALSVRIFGLNSWSILVPQALMGVASVGAAVRRRCAAGSAPAAGLIAGAVLALTPVAALMFRFNNPDALLVLLLVGAAYATVRAHRERAHRGGSSLAGALVGFAFLTKMLQAFLVLPGVRAGLPGRRPAAAAAGGSGDLLARRRRDGRRRRLVGRLVELWPASAGPTSAARRPTACSS